VTPDELDPTPELLAAVRAERARLSGFVSQLDERRARLHEELTAVTAQLDAARERERQLLHVLGEEGEDVDDGVDEDHEGLTRRTADHDNGALRGAAIRRAAVAVALAQDDRPGRARHYRAWMELIEAAGERIDGRDPAATLLTQLSRCPLIVRAPEAGTYQLDPHALARLRERRRALLAEADAQVATASEREYDALDLAQALARVQADVQRTERALAEAEQLVDRLDAAWFFTTNGDGQRGAELAAQTAAA
jgi:hypothetical protein